MTVNYNSFPTLFSTEIWCGGGGSSGAPITSYGHITSEDFNKMRSGNYKTATKNIQEKWKFVGLNLIPKVNTSWSKSDTRKEVHMSEVISLSDEVIVEWFFYAYFEEWKKKHEKLTTARKYKTVVEKTPQRKKKGEEHASKKYLFPFFVMMSDLNIKHCAEDKADITTWDEALKQEENDRLKEKQNGKRGQAGEENSENGTTTSGGKQKKAKEWHDGIKDFDIRKIIYGKGKKAVV